MRVPGSPFNVLLLALILATRPMLLEAREIRTRYDLELRAGSALVCGTCKENAPWRPQAKVDLVLKSFLP
ncbi:MAG: hypothetical protein K8S54_03335, partial [Spirochaetia bacterium]|nr:hypothetical protein [Spirochaetia bacterium]